VSFSCVNLCKLKNKSIDAHNKICLIGQKQCNSVTINKTVQNVRTTIKDEANYLILIDTYGII
jgi:hypothetical protein